MQFTDQELIEKIPKHDLRAVARLITLVENRVPRSRTVQKALFQNTGKAHVIGITGSPGAGKSTLVDQFARALRKQNKKVAVLAIDPTSPFSGGAVLGDRIRMATASEDSGVFIRSMATRGALGGISRATIDSIQILDAAGFDYILVETVGVGQAEVDIVRTAHTCIVVMVPGMGDSVQAIKAGILEIADLFVINKSDREGADLLHKDLRVILSLVDLEQGDWEVPIIKSVATDGTGISEIVTNSAKHLEWLNTSGKGADRKFTMVKDQIIKTAHDIIEERIHFDRGDELTSMAKLCLERKLDPYSAALKLIT